jgi:serine/threonine protein kinase
MVIDSNFRSGPNCGTRTSFVRNLVFLQSTDIDSPAAFFGANDFDDTPFIVMRYMPNGNAREFLQKIPTYNRLNIVTLPGDITVLVLTISIAEERSPWLALSAFTEYCARGLESGKDQIASSTVSLISTQLNILIDNDGTAVLCDFGLSRVKADMMSRSAEDDVGSELGAGSRNWMSPERLRGGLPKKASDIYAFGMTVYEASHIYDLSHSRRSGSLHLDFRWRDSPGACYAARITISCYKGETTARQV